MWLVGVGRVRGRRHRWSSILRARQGPYQKYLKSSNVENSDEGGTLALGAVERLVDASDHPLEELLIHSLADGLHCILHLQVGSAERAT